MTPPPVCYTEKHYHMEWYGGRMTAHNQTKIQFRICDVIFEAVGFLMPGERSVGAEKMFSRTSQTTRKLTENDVRGFDDFLHLPDEEKALFPKEIFGYSLAVRLTNNGQNEDSYLSFYEEFGWVEIRAWPKQKFGKDFLVLSVTGYIDDETSTIERLNAMLAKYGDTDTF